MKTLRATAKAVLTRTPSPPRRTHLLAFHQIGESDDSGTCSRARMDAHIARLPCDPSGATIFFDDAYESAAEPALELAGRGLRVIFALPTGLLTGEKVEGLLNEPTLDTVGLRRLMCGGVGLLPHGHLHLNADSTHPNVLVQDAYRSLNTIARFTGRPPIGYVFPYGKSTRVLNAALRHRGVMIGYGLGGARVRASGGLRIQNRFCLSNATNSEDERFAQSGWFGWV